MIGSREKKEIVSHGRSPSGFIIRDKVLRFAIKKLTMKLPRKTRTKVRHDLLKFVMDPRTKDFPLSTYIDVISTMIEISADIGSGGSIILTKLFFELGMRLVLRIGQRWPQIYASIRKFREQKTSLLSIEELTTSILRQVIRFNVLVPSQIIAFSRFITTMVREDEKFDKRR